MPFSTLLPCRILEWRNWTFPGDNRGAAKISSDADAIQLRLVPKPKLILQLRELFANAYIVGWKFELDGKPEDVVRKGLQQIRLNRTNACVINGAAFGPGFGFCTGNGLVHTAATRDELADWLVNRLGEETLIREARKTR